MLTEGFFHADPHPGNLLWADGKIWLLDLGMVGTLEEEPRGLLLLLLLAFWREDADFLADVLLMLGEGPSDVDVEALRADLRDYLERFRVSSLSDIELGPMLDGMIQIAAKHRIRLPASLAMTGKAFGQMQLAVAELDPELDPFSSVSGFMFKGMRERLGGALDLQRAVYETQKLKLRATRLIEGIERLTGARPGPGLQIELRGSRSRSRTRSGAPAGGSRSRSRAARRCSPPCSRPPPTRSTPGCRSRSASPPASPGSRSCSTSDGASRRRLDGAGPGAKVAALPRPGAGISRRESACRRSITKARNAMNAPIRRRSTGRMRRRIAAQPSEE